MDNSEGGAQVTSESQPAVQQAVDRAVRDYAAASAGEVSSVYPALKDVDPELFGAAIADVRGQVFSAGEVEATFALMSCSKPFVFALACQERGLDEVRARVGLNATGLPFNSSAAVEREPSSRTNPMVNSGALATIALVPGSTVDEQWGRIVRALSGFAGRALVVNDRTYASVSDANHGNRNLANLLAGRQALEGEPQHAAELYTRASCLGVTAMDLALMGATLANGGVNPVTGTSVVDPGTARAAIAVMAVAGLYETTGDWLMDVGLPAKSGIGGGIVSVAPGQLGMGTYSPRLDPAGNSVRGQLAAQRVARDLGLDIFSARGSTRSARTFD